MPTDLSAAALGLFGEVPDESPLPEAAVSPDDLAGLAAVIEQLEALIAPDAAPAPDGSAAIERIADIAFVLHERDVEPSLCDALDAAVREIGESGRLESATARRAQEAAALLRGLSDRVNALMARAKAEEGADLLAAQAIRDVAQSAAGRFDDAEPAGEGEITNGLFAAGLPQDDEFAHVVAMLAESLPVPHGQEAAFDPPLEAAAIAESDSLPASIDAVEMALVIESGDAGILGEFSSASSALSNAATVEPPAERLTTDVRPVEDSVHGQAPSDVPSSNEVASTEDSPGNLPGDLPSMEPAIEVAPVPSEDSALAAVPALPEPDVVMPTNVEQHADEILAPVAAEPSRTLLPEVLPEIDPNEDPGELFEPIAGSGGAPLATPSRAAPPEPTNAAAGVEKISPTAREIEQKPVHNLQVAADVPDVTASAPSASAESDEKLQAPLAPSRSTSVAPPAASRPPPADPLAPVRALNEDELIALFS
jgi:hypothetical protein